jgi:sporulation protein YlmC with PRC-barrel domain
MADNLMSAVSRFLTPELIGKMASASGIDRGVAQKAVDASVPAILGSLANLASEPGGARQLANAVADQPVGILGSLASSIGGSSQLADKGAGLLSSLLGGSAVGTLASTVGRFVGIGDGPARTLMGLLAPAVLGVLGREQRAAGLEANGLARMLTGQKDQITAAMPAGLAGLLKTDDLRDSIDVSRARTYEAPRTVSPTMQRMVSDPQPERARVGWPLWLLPLLALAGLVWYLMPHEHTTRQATAPEPTRLASTTAPTGPYIAKAADDWMSISTYYNQDIYNRSGEKLGTVKDLLVGRDGKINAAVIGIGRFLGIGEKDVAVPLSGLQIEQRDNNSRRLVVDAAKDALQAAPAFNPMSGVRLINGPSPPSAQPAQPKPKQ